MTRPLEEGNPKELSPLRFPSSRPPPLLNPDWWETRSFNFYDSLKLDNMYFDLPSSLSELEELARLLTARGETLGTAESCTGGLISALITSLPGSSRWFKGGVISYANEIKSSLLGVPEELLLRHGAVSEACALAMTAGAIKMLGVDHSLAVTGIAGPDGGTLEKPVGTVWLAWSVAGQTAAAHCLYTGNRAEVRAQAAAKALSGLLDMLKAQ